LDLTGLAASIADAATSIDFGRRGFAIRGREQEGRISYEKGIAQAMSAFAEAQTSGDPYVILFIEYTLLMQEFRLCDESDKEARDSLAQAIQSFSDAFLVLKVVNDAVLYNAVDKAFPHHNAYRVNGFPKDSFHIACRSHRTRIQNTLRSIGIDPIEKTLLKQRFSNLATATSKYLERQKKSLATGTGKE